jgi:hypothetical protein
MPYSVEIKPSALASLKRLPKGIAARISDKIEVLSKEPRPQGVEKLAGEENLYRIRMGSIRRNFRPDLSRALIPMRTSKQSQDAPIILQPAPSMLSKHR